jgi:hypothetical protein
MAKNKIVPFKGEFIKQNYVFQSQEYYYTHPELIGTSYETKESLIKSLIKHRDENSNLRP